MYTVYVLRSLKDGRRYIGYTSNVDRRLKEHDAGRTESTKYRRPWEMIYSESYTTEKEAKEREKFFKSGRGREELEMILHGAVPKW